MGARKYIDNTPVVYVKKSVVLDKAYKPFSGSFGSYISAVAE